MLYSVEREERVDTWSIRLAKKSGTFPFTVLSIRCEFLLHTAYFIV